MTVYLYKCEPHYFKWTESIESNDGRKTYNDTENVFSHFNVSLCTIEFTESFRERLIESRGIKNKKFREINEQFAHLKNEAETYGLWDSENSFKIKLNTYRTIAAKFGRNLKVKKRIGSFKVKEEHEAFDDFKAEKWIVTTDFGRVESCTKNIYDFSAKFFADGNPNDFHVVNEEGDKEFDEEFAEFFVDVLEQDFNIRL